MQDKDNITKKKHLKNRTQSPKGLIADNLSYNAYSNQTRKQNN